MEEIITKIQNDSALMLMFGIGVVVLLVIVLVIVISAMRVKGYKERFWYVEAENEAKTKKIEKLENESQALKIENTNFLQKLEQFAEIKEKLQTTHDAFLEMQTANFSLEKELHQTQTKLENSEHQRHTLEDEYERLKEEHTTTQEENSKFRTNNARLLMKLETEERVTHSHKEMLQSYKKEMYAMFTNVMKKIDDEEVKQMLKELEVQLQKK